MEDYYALCQEAERSALEKLSPGDQFELKDLFDPIRWKGFGSDVRMLGKAFSNQVAHEKISCVRLLDGQRRGSNLYVRIYESVMKQLVCEMCGSSDLVKDGGVFVCQSCGCKYSVEEAKRMMVGGTVSVEGVVDVQGTVQVDNSSYVQRYLANARRAKEKEDWEETERYYNMVEQNEPENIEAIFYSSYAKAMQSLVESDIYKRQAAFRPLRNSISILDDHFDTSHVGSQVEVIRKAIYDVLAMCSENFVYKTTRNGYGITIRDESSETYALFAGLMIEFFETIDNIVAKLGDEHAASKVELLQLKMLLLEVINRAAVLKRSVKRDVPSMIRLLKEQIYDLDGSKYTEEVESRRKAAAEKARKEAEEKKQQEEAERRRAEYWAANKKRIIAGVLSFALIAAGVSAFMWYSNRKAVYDQAVSAMEAEDYESAVALFGGLGSFSDSSDLLIDCKILLAREYAKNNSRSLALSALKSIDDGSSRFIEARALCYLDLGSPARAWQILEEAGITDGLAAAEVAKASAEHAMKVGMPDEAKEWFMKAGYSEEEADALIEGASD